MSNPSTTPPRNRQLSWLAAIVGGLPGLMFFTWWAANQGWRGDLPPLMPWLGLVAGVAGALAAVAAYVDEQRDAAVLNLAAVALFGVSGAITIPGLLGTPILGAIFAFGAYLQRHGHRTV